MLSLYSQVAIGKTTIDGAGILDFDINKGVLLPWIENLGSLDSDGTLVFDTADNKVKGKVNGVWVDLSLNSGVLDANELALISTHLSKTEADNDQGVIIGAETSTSIGVLVLEADNKALILPKMASPQNNLIDPKPGTIIYDTVENLLCIYNGSEWTLWGF